MVKPVANFTIIPDVPGEIRWSPHLKGLLEQGWLQLREMLLKRGPESVGVIAEEKSGSIRVKWMSRAHVRAICQRLGRSFHSLELEHVPPDRVRILVTAKDGEQAACRVPLGSIRFSNGGEADAKA